MKVYLVALVAVLVISCQKPKDWDCTCEYSALRGSGKESMAITNKKRMDANEYCTQFGKDLIRGNGSYKCKLTVK